ncbi:cinnamoyl-CoA reductase 1 isoform X2 [Macadamia integrifolia]|uniref:cinnamoyl-CoA reductase 1 isoform X2 n=1 Tax=Macadamia integrifolia TaxID=60698 RepID=UPI001C531FCD|nr:cinnamoyl-CoA reductase 1 isoform X2 [Macadamia integrifolia]
MASRKDEVVCVTGGSGFIGSWLVRLLLDCGYTVHATVKDLNDERETKHLEALEGADSRLRLFQIDLLDYDSLLAAINGTVGVFHLASPCIVDRVLDPQLWYPASKTMAEKAAWEFAEKQGLDVVVVNPGTVMGPVLPPTINASMIMLVRLLEGCSEEYEDYFMGSVHVKDVALAHILVYENKSASGRHLCVEAISHYGDFAAKVSELYPEYKLPRLPKDTQPGLLRSKNGSKKLMDLGLQFSSMEEIIKDSVESLKSKGYIS